MKTRSPLTQLAEWIQSDVANLSAARFDKVKQHIVDTVAARAAGRCTDEGAAIDRLGASMPDRLQASVLVGCAQVRCTEVDDIHLTSCTTPGSVIVPVALALAANGEQTVGECCAAVLVGYEALIRLGVAIDGPIALLRRAWPTHAAAAFGSAAAASRVYGLSVDQTAGALATALAFGSGPPVSALRSSSSRWTTLGVAAANGELAARAAREGIGGGADEAMASPQLVRGLGRRLLFDDVGMKPFPCARQGLAAVQAARDIAAAERLAPIEIEDIVVRLPEPQRRIVDRPDLPRSRFSSIVSVQYQIALALTAPERLLDVARTPPFWQDNVRRLMTKVRVRRARVLDARYPRAWPARVEIKARGRRFSRLVLHPDGDARRPLGWDQIAQKFAALAGPRGAAAADHAINAMRRAGRNDRMPALWELP